MSYATFLGGSGNDVANGIAVDAAGEAYVAGYTDSTNWPVQNALFSSAGGQGDGFVAKLAAAGNSLMFSTYLGGSQVDLATAVTLDAAGDVYITGSTLSIDFPVTAGAFQTSNQGSYDAFVLRAQHDGRLVSLLDVRRRGSRRSGHRYCRGQRRKSLYYRAHLFGALSVGQPSADSAGRRGRFCGRNKCRRRFSVLVYSPRRGWRRSRDRYRRGQHGKCLCRRPHIFCQFSDDVRGLSTQICWGWRRVPRQDRGDGRRYPLR